MRIFLQHYSADSQHYNNTVESKDFKTVFIQGDPTLTQANPAQQYLQKPKSANNS